MGRPTLGGFVDLFNSYGIIVMYSKVPSFIYLTPKVRNWLEMGDTMSDFLKFAAICILLLIIIGGALYALDYIWTDFLHQNEVRQLEAKASWAEALAAKTQAEAERTREEAFLAQAEADKILAAGEADAIRAPAEAAARTVDRQSAVLVWWGVLTPFGVVLGTLILLVAGFGLGMTAVVAGAAFVKLGVKDSLDKLLARKDEEVNEHLE